MIHGDAYPKNLIYTRDRVGLADWDSVSYGPREQDIVPASIRHRFGHPKAKWQQFCAAYGVDPPSLPMLRQMRELRTLGPYIRSSGDPQARPRWATASPTSWPERNANHGSPWT
jgi:aminoglycoside phosphotransferase (APT) family kinase protein